METKRQAPPTSTLQAWRMHGRDLVGKEVLTSFSLDAESGLGRALSYLFVTFSPLWVPHIRYQVARSTTRGLECPESWGFDISVGQASVSGHFSKSCGWKVGIYSRRSFCHD